MNKRVLSAILAFILSAGILSACAAHEDPADPEPEEKEQIFSADTLLDEDGSFGNDSDGTLTVAFIGGSLTDAQSFITYQGRAYGGKSWTNTICRYLEEKFPNRQIKPINAGVTGTTSDYGALRFENSILQYGPDIIFIEYTVNDMGFSSREDSQKYMEAMVRMSQQLDKIPVIVFMYTANVDGKDTDQHIRWEQGKNWKQEIADYYGLGSINIYDYIYSLFEASEYDVFYDFIEATKQYGKNGEGWDVHGGYKYYAEAIIKALDENPSSLIKHPDVKTEWFENGSYKDTAYIKYNIIRAKTDRLKYTGEWMLYTMGNATVAPSYFSMGNTHGEFAGLAPHKDKHGLMTTTDQTATIELTTDANALILDYKSTDEKNRMNADVYVDGEFLKEISITSQYVGMHYIQKIAEFSDGLQHTVKLTMKPSSAEIPVFEFTTITEAYTEAALQK